MANSNGTRKARRQAARELAEIAHHEAGHAIAAHVLGLDFGETTIVPGEDGWHGPYAGLCEVPDPVPPPRCGVNHRERVRLLGRFLTALWAGPAAEVRFNDPTAYLDRSQFCTPDFFDSLHALRRGPYPGQRSDDAYDTFNMQVFWDVIEQRAERFVKAQWDVIQAVAAALLERKTLSRDDVVKVINAARRRRGRTRRPRRAARPAPAATSPRQVRA